MFYMKLTVLLKEIRLMLIAEINKKDIMPDLLKFINM